MSIQQLMLGVGASKKTYLDDVFSTFLYTGTSTATARNNGIDLAGEGGLVWVKRRDGTTSHQLTDTVRGKTNVLASESSAAQTTSVSNGIEAFNSNGFTVGGNTAFNATNDQYSSWTFRKAPGFFDVVTFNTGSPLSSNQRISHSLGCVPGFILVKNLDGSEDWGAYHREKGGSGYFRFNQNNAFTTSGSVFFDPTATDFGFNSASWTGANTDFVAYLFAGGESTAATARSVDFDGTGDYLNIAASSDFDIETNWTAECWFKCDALNTSGDGYDCIMGNWASSQEWLLQYSGTTLGFYNANTASKTLGTTADAPLGQWNHVAISKQGSTTRIFLNGTQVVADFDMGTIDSSSAFQIGACSSGSGDFNGRISNVRIVKGTAVYTSSFRVPTEPLTNITNTKLLCCNNSSTTGSTVTPGTITANGDPTASSDSPFDDPAGFKFGDSKEGIVKCGSYVGNGSSTGPEINLGWEPQYILLKDATSNNSWRVYDSMRGIVTGGDDELVHPNSSGAAYSGGTNEIDLTSTGFKAVTTEAGVNGNGSTIVYMAIRRSDGYVGKLAEAGDVFAMDTGVSTSTIPVFDSGFPVDFDFYRQPASSSDWISGSRLTGEDYIVVNSSAQASSDSSLVWDSNLGSHEASWFDNTYQAWMWKRHAGFDVVTAKGGQNKRIAHSLNKIPEMYWVKNRDAAENWTVYHKGLNSGTNPENRYIIINSHGGESGSDTSAWNSFVPTSTHISFGTMNSTGGNSSHNYLVMLFASVDGISKIGYYDGSNSAQTITTGFQPRFAIIRRVETTDHWFVLDTLNGWGSGNDHRLRLSLATAEGTGSDYGAPTSTGFSLTGNMASTNTSGGKYIYYAHA